jgi:hypothetical protein
MIKEASIGLNTKIKFIHARGRNRWHQVQSHQDSGKHNRVVIFVFWHLGRAHHHHFNTMKLWKKGNDFTKNSLLRYNQECNQQFSGIPPKVEAKPLHRSQFHNAFETKWSLPKLGWFVGLERLLRNGVRDSALVLRIPGDDELEF